MARGRKHVKKRRKDRKYLSIKQEIEREEELEAKKLAMDLRNSVVNGDLAINKDIKNTIRDSFVSGEVAVKDSGIIICNKDNKVDVLTGLDKDGAFGPQAGLEFMTADGYGKLKNEDSEIDKRIDSMIEELDKFIENNEKEKKASEEELEKLSEKVDKIAGEKDKMVLETGEITEVVEYSQTPQEALREPLEGPGVISKEDVKSSQKARMALSEVFWNVFVVVATIFMIVAIFMMWLLFKMLFG